MRGDPILTAAGPLQHHYETTDWAATPIGPLASWGPALRDALGLALESRFPVALFWGRELTLLYNEAFVSLIADKHPAALGARAEDVFPEAWDAIGALLHGVLEGRGATWLENTAVPLQRHGRLDEAYFTFSYSPVRGADGTIEGVLDIAAETTRMVVDRRRLDLLGRLGEQLGDLEEADEVRALALPVLRTDAADMPAVDIRLEGPGAGSGDGGLPAAPAGPLGDEDIVVEDAPAGRVAWLPLAPAASAGKPVLVVRLSDHLAHDDAYLGFLQLVADSLAQALDRIAVREAERRMAAGKRALSETLQHSLLSPPAQPGDLTVAVRYQPAAEGAEVGGDWYDAFELPDGTLAVTIGDVTGHDGRAAAGMAQIRNLLRGVAYAVTKPPAAIVSVLDDAMRGLGVDLYATAIFAKVEPASGARRPGRRTLRWSSAGHPPPVLIEADGRARLLETPADVLLGLAAGGRTDHVLELEPGATLVLYTDGLVERRTTPLTERLQWLAGVLECRHELSPEAICDLLIASLGGAVEDDVALLVLRNGR